MSEIRNLTRNGETFYPLTHVDAIVSNTGSGIDDEPTAGSDNPVKSGGVYSTILPKIQEISTDLHCVIDSKTGNVYVLSSTHVGYVNTYIINPTFKYKVYGVMPKSSNYCMIAYYDKDEIFIDRENIGKDTDYIAIDDYSLSIPENAKFVKVYENPNYNSKFGVYLDNYSMLNAGYLIDCKGLSEVVGTKIDSFIPITIKEKHYWNSEGEIAEDWDASSHCLYEPIEIDHTKDYIIHIYNSDSSRQNPVLLVDNNYKILMRYPRYASAIHDFYLSKKDTINAKYILLTTRTSQATSTYIAYVSYNNVKELFGGQFNFNGKNVAIIGDSISTNGDWSPSNPLGNVPEIVISAEDVGITLSAYATSYDVGVTIGGHEITSEDIGVELTFTPTADDIGKIIGKPYTHNASGRKVWWEVAMDVLGFNPIAVSWSGSSVTDHENSRNPSYAFHPSQIRKCGIRVPGSMTRIAPDIVIIYRGTNDFSHSPYTYLTNYLTTYPQIIPSTDVVEIEGVEKYGYIEGLVMTIDRIRTAYPEAKIVLCTLNYFHRLLSGQPTRNGINTIYDYNNAIRAVADYFGCQIIEFDKDGITYANAVSGEYYESDEPDNPTHPSNKGHKVMGNKAIRDLLSQTNSMV